MAMSQLDSIFARDRRTCHICGHKVPRPEATRDHVKVKSQGGYDKSKNYRLAHRDCNNARGDLDIETVYEIAKSMPGVAASVLRQALSDRRSRGAQLAD